MSARLPASTLAALRDALFEALADPNLAEARATLGIRGASVLTVADYRRVLDIERKAKSIGYPRWRSRPGWSAPILSAGGAPVLNWIEIAEQRDYCPHCLLFRLSGRRDNFRRRKLGVAS